jgi:hypothetical protein
MIKEIQRKLADDPRGFGEIYKLRGNVEEYKALHGALGLDYSVDVSRRVVLVRNCTALTGLVD